MKHYTTHLRQRQGQRGISDYLIELAFSYGKEVSDKFILGKKIINDLICTIKLNNINPDKKSMLKDLNKALKRGGVVVVAVKDILITTYYYDN